MRSAISRRRRSRAVVVGVGAVALSLVSASAGATVLSGDDPLALATAIVSTAPLTGATLAVDYACISDDPATTPDEGMCPTGVGTSATPLAGFPTNGDTFGIITSGNAALADDANNTTNAGKDWNVDAAPIGPGVYDYQIVRIDLGAATGNCLAFDFKFLSEEYPEYVSSGYNDAFIAQLNTWAVTADPANQQIIAPGNFAAGAGDIISVDGSGPSAMTAEQAVGSTYDGSTLPLIARAPVTPGATNSLFLTIFDQGDGIYDSAAFVDNLRYETLAAGQCKSLALDPFEGTTGVVLTPGTTGTFSPTLSTFTIPLTSNLPTGPIATNLTATAAFVNWGDVVPRKSARMAQKATTALGSGSATIPAGGTGNLVITNTPTGIAAVQAAKAQPAALLAQAKSALKKAKKFTKKAKKLKKQAKTAPPAKAKKLTKKAKKLVKKAKKLKKTAAALTAQSKALAAQPLGTAVVTMTNPSNQKSEVLRIQIPR